MGAAVSALVRSEEVGLAGDSSGKPEGDVVWRHLDAVSRPLVPATAGARGLRIPCSSDGELCALVLLGHGLGFGALFSRKKFPHLSKQTR